MLIFKKEKKYKSVTRKMGLKIRKTCLKSQILKMEFYDITSGSLINFTFKKISLRFLCEELKKMWDHLHSFHAVYE